MPSLLTPATPERLTLRQARRIALLSQGFGRARPPRVTAQMLLRTAQRMRIVQIDSVNVLARSQYLPFFARLGPYDTALLDGLRDGRSVTGRRTRHQLVEYWAHEASLIPVQDWPLYGFRMRRAHAESWGGMRAVAREHPQLVDAVRQTIAEGGPMSAAELERVLADHSEQPARGSEPEWGWNWSLVKAACEHLFWGGEVTSAERTASFARRYAIPEQVLPRPVVQRGPSGEHPISESAAFRALVEAGARAHGIGTLRCLRDYARLKTHQAAGALNELLAQGVVREVEVAGWKGPIYLHREAPRPRAVKARALLSPFDPVVWQRERVHSLFDFEYRIGIYTPAYERVHGYYVLPFLQGDELVARVDLKADRPAGVLRVHRIHTEPSWAEHSQTDLVAELNELAGWLGLTAVDLAKPRPNPERLP